MTGRRRAVLIAGPTASGKSALALAMAQERNGIIVNTDAMQIYDVLQVVTARPGAADTALAEHRLYGTVPAATRFSTGQWLNAVRDTMAAADPARPLIFVGGTGLYFDALLNGFADIPEVPAAVTLEVQQEIQALDAAQRLALLAQEDPEAAARLGVADPQRLVRALAVKRSTGRPLSSYHLQQAGGLLADVGVEKLVLDPDRDILRQRIAARFEQMVDSGAVEEVRALRTLDLDPSLPVMKAIGVREIGDWLDGLASRDEAIERAVIATRQYAKRQRTWFRNRFGDWPRLA